MEKCDRHEEARHVTLRKILDKFTFRRAGEITNYEYMLDKDTVALSKREFEKMINDVYEQAYTFGQRDKDVCITHSH